jgi:bifunctional DNase/RNase
MIEMVIESVRVNPQNYQRVVILKEKTGERCLPIWIGPTEADAIAIKLQGATVPRPLTHDLMYSIICALTSSVDFIILNDIKGDTFYAKIMLKVSGKNIEIDSRPSDAMALAVRADVPIFVEEAVLNKGGIILDKATGEPTVPGKEGQGSGQQRVSEDELKKLSAFSDFINKIDLDDLGKNKS